MWQQVKRKLLLSTLLTGALFLSACDFFPDPVDPNQPNLEESEVGEETGEENGNEISAVEIQIDSEYYRPVISEDGTYSTSQHRGITRQLNSGVNIRTFESDLMRHSQRYFSTDTHFLQEGQFLSASEVYSWLARYEEPEEPEEDDEEVIEEVEESLGLNPPSNGSLDPNERNPNYLSSILEHDFYVQGENGMELAGLSIGLALNSIDYYRDEDRTPFEQSIPTEELLSEGQRMSDEVIARLRAKEGLENVPIMIALYEQSTQDDLAPGTYIAVGISEDGDSSVSEWNAINEDRLVFPLEGMQSAEGNSFANFRSEVENFFPNISGVTGVAHYVEEQLVHLQIDIMIQFYGKGEIIAFTQFLNEAALNYLPATTPIEIRVESLNGMESFLYRENDQEEFEVFIYN